MYIVSIVTILFSIAGLVQGFDLQQTVDKYTSGNSMVKYGAYIITLLAGAFVLRDTYSGGGGGGGGSPMY